MYPEKLWDYDRIASNPNTTREYILEHYLEAAKLNKEIKLGHFLMIQLSKNMNITIEDVLKYPDLPWCPEFLITNKNFTLGDMFVLLESSTILSDWTSDEIVYRYSSNPGLTLEVVKAYGEEAWNWYYVTQHPWVTESMLKGKHYPWSEEGFLCNPNLTMDFMLNTPNIAWHWVILSNPGITWEDIINRHCDRLDWWGVSTNPNITLEIVRNNLLEKWNWRALSHHPNITWDMIMDNPDLPWNKRHVSLNPNITWDIVRDNPEWPWCWESISKNAFSKSDRNNSWI